MSSAVLCAGLHNRVRFTGLGATVICRHLMETCLCLLAASGYSSLMLCMGISSISVVIFVRRLQFLMFCCQSISW